MRRSSIFPFNNVLALEVWLARMKLRTWHLELNILSLERRYGTCHLLQQMIGGAHDVVSNVRGHKSPNLGTDLDEKKIVRSVLPGAEDSEGRMDPVDRFGAVE